MPMSVSRATPPVAGAPADVRPTMSGHRGPPMPDVEVRVVSATNLLASLDYIQLAIRLFDPRGDPEPAVVPCDTELICLLRQERRIIRELRRREVLLIDGMEWRPSRVRPM